MAIGLHGDFDLREIAGADLSQAANTVLLSWFQSANGGWVRRLHLVAETANGILAPTVLKLSYSTDGGNTFTDLTNWTMTPGARARGVLVYRDCPTPRQTIPAGALVAVRVSTASGGASTARIIAEVQLEPFNGPSVNMPANVVKVTS